MGFLNILKPPGMTSHDVVQFVRKAADCKRVGHSGTLDPGAAGVLVVAVGKATRLLEFLPDYKSYRAQITFGIATDTQDAGGKITEEAPDCIVTREELQRAIAKFTGRIEQVPPMVSAVKHKGRRLYELAREGKTVPRKAREVEIRLLRLEEALASFPLKYGDRAFLTVECSGGTYIRTLCHDLGAEVGCPAHMSFLVRTGVGGFSIEESKTLEEVNEAARKGRVNELLCSPLKALSHLPAVYLDRQQLGRVTHGNAIALPKNLTDAADTVRLVHESELVAVARRRGGRLQPAKVVAAQSQK